MWDAVWEQGRVWLKTSSREPRPRPGAAEGSWKQKPSAGAGSSAGASNGEDASVFRL